MILKRINFPYETLKDIDDFRKSESIESEGETVRQLVGLGLLIHNMKHKINDESFLNEIKQATNANTMFDYLDTLEDSKLLALKEAVNLTRDNRFKQVKFV